MTGGAIQTQLRATKCLRAFTLVELMVAVTGGLFISIIVFAMARQGTRFYQQESRIAEATLASTIGMQRLRADIGRAGYMASPQITADSNLCTNLGSLGSVPLVQTMRSIQIQQENDPADIGKQRPAGGSNHSRSDSSIWRLSKCGSVHYRTNAARRRGHRRHTHHAATEYRRLGALQLCEPGAGQALLLQSLFPSGRALRLVNAYGKVAYGIINNTSVTGGPTGNLPQVDLKADPAIPLRGTGNMLATFRALVSRSTS